MFDRSWQEALAEPLFRLDDGPVNGLGGGSSLESLARRLQAGARTRAAGYVLHRVLLANYWHFDYQEIFVPHGRLFLLGENGSGKSTILGATIPLVLDGVVRPERLDTFGSTQRKIDHYVLGSAGAGTQRRTSYVALEFAWDGAPSSNGADQPLYLTLGICFVGNPDAQELVRPYRFVITNGRRLGIEIPLKSSEGRVHDGTYFRSLIRDGGIITERPAEYRDLVARHLFGYAEPQLMDHLIDVLLLLRHPGLAGRLETFNDVYDRLKSALPPLPAEITAQTTEAFDRIDDLRRHGARLQRQAAAAEAIYQADLDLARARLRLRAVPVVEAERTFRRRVDDSAARRRARTAADQAANLAEEQAEAAERELAAARQELADLRASPWAREVAGLDQEVARAEEFAGLTRSAREDAERTRAGRAREVADLRERLGAGRERWRRQLTDYRVRLTAFSAAAAKARWPAGQEAATTALARLPAEAAPEREAPATLPPLDLPLPALDSHRQFLAELDRSHHELAALVSREQAAAQARTRANEQARHAEDALAESQRALAAAWTALATRLSRLSLAADLDPAVSLLPLLAAAEAREATALDRALAAFANAARRAEATLAGEAEGLSRQLGELSAGAAELDAEIARLERPDAELVPAREPGREQARQALREAGLDARPLYALIDFAPTLLGERRGAIERALLDAGLLDALVIPDADQAAADQLLRARSLGDYRLALSAPAVSGPSSLVVDPELRDPAWRTLAERALGAVGESPALAASGMLSLAPDGSWQHGALAGYAGDSEPLGFIGTASRRARRERALQTALTRRTAIREQAAALESALASVSDRRQAVQATERAIRDAVQPDGQVREVDIRTVELRERDRALAAAHAAVAAAEEALASAAAAREASERDLAVAMAGLGASGPDHPLVRQVLDAVHRVEGLGYAAQLEVDRLGQTASQLAQDGARLGEREARLVEDEEHCREANARHESAESALRALRERLAAPDLRDFQTRLAAAEAREVALTDLARRRAERRGEVRAALQAAEQQLSDAAEREAEAAEACNAAVAAFADLLQQQPDLDEPAEAEILAQTEESGAADSALTARAQRLLSPDATSETLGHAADLARNRRQACYAEERAHLVGYDLFIAEDRDRVLVQRGEQNVQPLTDLLRTIGEQVRENQLLLNAEEEHLFKDYLCGAGLTAIHRGVQTAEALVGRINGILARTPLGRERYELVIDRRADRLDAAPPLARHYALLRKDPLVISDEERRVLFEAVRASVDEARRGVEEGTGGSFAEALAAAFDYREWFSLALYVNHPNGERQRISSRTARQRSGAQQLFALYVPLFAALAALYESAAPWAPRLFAMDEAFDKVSEDNITILLRFLVDLEFQWIVASPRLTGAGREVLPACADWQLFHDPIEGLAQAIPTFYWHGELYDPATHAEAIEAVE